LLRIVRGPDGVIAFDPTGSAEGRGAYLCAHPSCWTTAYRRSSLQSALRAPLPDEMKRRLEHGDVAAIPAIAGHGAPATNTGGTYGS